MSEIPLYEEEPHPLRYGAVIPPLPEPVDDVVVVDEGGRFTRGQRVLLRKSD